MKAAGHPITCDETLLLVLSSVVLGGLSSSMCTGNGLSHHLYFITILPYPTTTATSGIVSTHHLLLTPRQPQSRTCSQTNSQPKGCRSCKY